MGEDCDLLMWTAITVLVVAFTLCHAGIGSADPPAEDFIFPDREAFLRELRPDGVELAAVRGALERGEVEEAGEVFIAHFRGRPLDSPFLRDWEQLPRDLEYNTSRADGLLAGDFFDGYSTYTVPETGIDWDGAPLTCLTRFPVLPTLNNAFHHTRDPKYLRFIVDHVFEYMQAYPIERFADVEVDSRGFPQGWRGSFQVALPWHWSMVSHRLSHMANSIALIRAHPQVSDDELLQMLQRLYEETRWLQIYIGGMVESLHNGGMGAMNAMGPVAALLVDFEKTEQWAARNVELLNTYIDGAFYPDGSCIELTTAYSMSVARSTQASAHAMREYADFTSVRPRLAEIVTSVLALSAPTGSLPSFGDHYAGHFTRGVHEPLLEEMEELAWALAMVRGQTEPPPPFTVWPVPGQQQWSGYYSMRSDWTPDALFMMLDGGPWGTSHRHGDRLSFVVTAHGADFIVDPSSTKYHDNSPDAFLSKLNAGFLHNTVTVDGVDQFESALGEDGETVRKVPRLATEPLQNTWEHGTRHSLWISDFSFAPVLDARWERRVIFADNSYWLLQDVIVGEGFAGAGEAVALEQNFQFARDIEIEFDGPITIATAPNGARLVLLPLEGTLRPTLTIGDETPHQTWWPDGVPRTEQWLYMKPPYRAHGRGWTARFTHDMFPSPAVTHVGEAVLPKTLTMAIIPLAPGQDFSDLPEITHTVTAAGTIWQLPVAGATLEVTTTEEGCAIAQ
ncbi:MAG: heparinase II/III family protein [Armatimonadota bacterium]